MILMIDNYDSFTYNLVQYLGELYKDEIRVFRNDRITVEEIDVLSPQAIIISPGPCSPREAGISVDVISALGKKIPLLGVCLGHQSIGFAFGGKVIRAPYLMHGKVSQIHHNGQDIFQNLPVPFTATRYHSLIVERKTLPECLQVTAETDDGLIMGLRHREYPVYGVQFHPESILTEGGKTILSNFLGIAGALN
ncbi:MAG TPA: aminodeoxychorismate/anthranilate synthase component II [Chitinispirillaceae bacterium]|jgi:anthranilate synthase/aminodeoxychorismate synthase-like glutamine amidotransferase|nr:aminodeoxychorismate/anthranilate synthase component II [Chitinispirillaceae bacterium]